MATKGLNLEGEGRKSSFDRQRQSVCLNSPYKFSQVCGLVGYSQASLSNTTVRGYSEVLTLLRVITNER